MYSKPHKKNCTPVIDKTCVAVAPKSNDALAFSHRAQ